MTDTAQPTVDVPTLRGVQAKYREVAQAPRVTNPRLAWSWLFGSRQRVTKA
jgi:hypothetical protein